MSAYLEALRTRQPLPTANLRGMQDRWESPPEVEDTPTLDEQTDCAIEVIGRACRATSKAAAADLLRNAAAMLTAIADEVSE